MTQPRCELCRFWDGEWAYEAHPHTRQIEVDDPSKGGHLAPFDLVRSKGRRTCRRFPSHDVRHKDDWCGEFVAGNVCRAAFPGDEYLYLPEHVFPDGCDSCGRETSFIRVDGQRACLECRQIFPNKDGS